MKKKIFAAVAIFSLVATVALGVAVNSSDHFAISLPGDYSVQFSTSYVGPERMRSVSLVKVNGALATTTREVAQACPADQAPTGEVLASAAQACPADQAPTGEVLASAAQACPADQAPTGEVLASAAQACPADQAPTGEVLASAAQACPADQAPTGAVLASAAQACPADQAPTTDRVVKVLGSLF